MHDWLVKFVESWWEDRELEIVIKAPRLWDVADVLQGLHHGAVLKRVFWIMPDLEEE